MKKQCLSLISFISSFLVLPLVSAFINPEGGSFYTEAELAQARTGNIIFISVLIVTALIIGIVYFLARKKRKLKKK